jgi:signal transduction histidine kinase
VVNLINAGIDQVRRLARGLDPIEVEGAGLKDALTQLADDTQKVFGIPCVFRCDETVPRFDPAISLQLYRIVQEAIHNARKHGTAKSIHIELAVSEDQVSLRIADDGRGFPESGIAHGGMGLRIMKRRARAIGASLNIESQAGRGTRITCVVQTHRRAGQPSNGVPGSAPPVGRSQESDSPESEGQ